MPTVPPPTLTGRPWSGVIAAGLLVLAALAAYHNSFSGPFVYDDIAAIKENPTIVDLSNLSAVLTPPNDSGITVNGRPMVNLSLALNYALGGTEVAGYHLVNLVIHVLAALALFGALRRTFELPRLRPRFGAPDTALPLAFCIALLWTVHPLQTESVTYVVQRAESLVGLFYLVTFYCFLRSVSSDRPALWQALAVLACFCGMTTKEVMASAPLLVLLLDRAAVSGTFRSAWQRHRRLYLGLAATWLPLAWLVAGTGNRGGTAGLGAGGISSWDYALTSALGLGKYLKLTFWPHPLVFDYGTAIEKDLLPVLPQGLLIVGLVIATGYALKRHPLLGFLGLWFFAILGPSSSFIPIATEPLAEHRMYLPLASVLTVVVIGVWSVIGRRSFILWVILAAGAGWLTVRRNVDYQSEMSLWRDTVNKYPSSARAHNNVGEILYRQEKFEEAIACFREAVRLLPNYIDALNNLGNSLSEQHQPAEALDPIGRALRFKPGHAASHNNYGNALYKLGRKDEAVAHYRDSVRFKPTFADAHNNLGVVLAEQGHVAEAILHYEEALRLKRDYVDAHYNYGNALNQSGRTAEAMTQFAETLRLKPTHAEANNNLGSILYQQGKLEAAKARYEAAVRLKRDYPDAENNLGVALFQSGRLTEALPHFESALKLKPDYTAARENLAEVKNNLGAGSFKDGKLEEARAQFQAAVHLNPGHPGAHNNLGVVLWRLARPGEALPHLREAVRLKPDYTEAQQALAALETQLSPKIPPIK